MVTKKTLRETRKWAKKLEPVIDRLQEIAESDSNINEFRIDQIYDQEADETILSAGSIRILIFCDAWEKDGLTSCWSVYFYFGEHHTDAENETKIKRLNLALDLLRDKRYGTALMLIKTLK